MSQHQGVLPSAAELEHARGFAGFDLDDYRQVAARLGQERGDRATHERVLFEMLVAQVHLFAFDRSAVESLQTALIDGGAGLTRAVEGIRGFAVHFGLDLDAATRVAREV